MSSTTSPNQSTEDDIIANTTPFLQNPPTSPDHNRRSLRRQSLSHAAQFLRRASTRRRNIRSPSVLVRETAAEQLEERQSDWAYSKPVVILDLIWNLSFLVVASVVLGISYDEAVSVPLRVWIVGYGLQCVVHMGCVCVEYRRRRRRFLASGSSGSGGGAGEGDDSSGEDGGEEQYVSLAQFDEEGTSMAKHLESANTMFSFIWWIMGFYWVSAGGQDLARDSPQLYWLCIVFLAFDVFFVVFCVALACVIGIAVCCCLPCIIAILYAVTDQEGASNQDVEQLSKYKFRKIGDVEKLSGEIQGSCGGIMTECGTDTPIEHVLSSEDAECCICISGYDDGVELRQLPCGHHFHATCVDKWLYINATCPLCKYNILKSSNHGREEV